jgi:Universal stress protein UspA and related nucleotide-binding proteins
MFKILVPVNGSDCSLKAVDEAIRAAQESRDAVIQLVNVQPLFPRYVSRFLSRGETEAMRQDRARQAFEPAQRRVETAGVCCTVHMLRGRIVESVAGFAARQGVDEIVVGTSPVHGFARLLRQPIADRLIKASDIPVDVVTAGEVSMLERYGLPAGLGIGLSMMWFANE